MSCYHPLTAYKLLNGLQGKNGRTSSCVVFDPPSGGDFEEIKLPCGRCVGCRLEKSRQWAMRCINEYQTSDFGYFITLTYDDDHLPENSSLNIRDMQLFFKRLRKKYAKDINFRYFYCGEYGSQTLRPHYHLLLFGDLLRPDVRFLDDRSPRGLGKSGLPLYTSKTLEKLWKKGFCPFGAITFESAAYVARYTLKKVGDYNEDFYSDHKKEFILMSRRPAIGRLWLDLYSSDLYPSDFYTTRGKKVRPPKYYDRLFRMRCPDEYDNILQRRKEVIVKNELENTDDRLLVKEQVKLSQLKGLSERNL